MTVRYVLSQNRPDRSSSSSLGGPFGPFYPGQTLFFSFFSRLWSSQPPRPKHVYHVATLWLRGTAGGGGWSRLGAAGGRGRGAGGPSFRCAAVVVTRRSSRSGPRMAMLALADDRGGRGRRQLLPTCRGRMGGTEAAHMVADARPCLLYLTPFGRKRFRPRRTPRRLSRYVGWLGLLDGRS